MKFNISMPLNMYKKVKEKAGLKAMSVSQYIRFCIIEYWEMTNTR